MKLLVQWTRANPRTWEEYDTSQVAALPRKTEPSGNETIDDTPGWAHGLCVQGAIFNGRDHYGIKFLPDGIVVVMWNDDPKDFHPGTFSAFERTIKPPAYDSRLELCHRRAGIEPTVENTINARQWLTIYGQDDWLLENQAKWQGVRTVSGPVIIRPWSEFTPPSIALHGIWVDDPLNDQHSSLQVPRDWREWIE